MDDKDKKELESVEGVEQEQGSQSAEPGTADEAVTGSETGTGAEEGANADDSKEAEAAAEGSTEAEADVDFTEPEAVQAIEAIEPAQAAAKPDYYFDGQANTGAGFTPSPSSSSSKAWPIISLILAAGLVIALVFPLLNNKKDVVATVNGTKITQDELYNELVKAGGGEQAKQALNAIVMKTLITQEAKKKNIVVTEEDINAEIDNYIKSFGSLEMLEQMLQQYGMTMDDLKQDSEMNVMITKLLEDKTNVTEDEVKQTFETYKESFNTPEQVRASIILVETEDEANEVIQQLKDGKDFAELAKDKSLDTFTKDSGGDTGFFERGQVEPAVEEAAFKLKQDEVSGAVKTDEGYKVIKLTDRKEAKEGTLEENKEEIRKGLVAQQVQELFGDWYSELESQAKITNKLTDADTAKSDNSAS
ncbi:peptidylprolyl isomerase [Paenibacillus woosongensis]|uniref:peptidylprolyl isomerase n=1 Tax=Paenibacillus woosongensis TaxID=307580 RepID=A0A7X3CLJ3_9BACL|nr:peptidylprolyl isomerase [Paenibacillus woosongensis]MUG44065.1 peptidylprolyl isomerase [Paenibacillus woosongensis]